MLPGRKNLFFTTRNMIFVRIGLADNFGSGSVPAPWIFIGSDTGLHSFPPTFATLCHARTAFFHV